jgi:predicted nucleic-acid-binding protein
VRAADTNVVVRLLARDDERQVALGEAFVAPGAWVSLVVLVAVVWVLHAVHEFDAAGHLPLGAFDRDLGKLDGAQRLK